ncbi:GntR family transcriptional regulator [Thermogymnomonas acidicola]|uniref:GntR family transcriptional regulator n=1 Tax=Thermogymnomonas acidicola TaxID=399579 RepID=A0AA37F8M0_9ARCH|nr:GntR family transcriptional regulator [Thermogymnomonas acidicola]GGM66652.1 GntR family transcriptional regulator [Thermogymnomonas acidicola]
MDAQSQREKDNLSEVAYRSLINKIVYGEIHMGQTLTETQLIKLLGMSRTPIREALIALETEGLLFRTGRSFSVLFLSAEEIKEMYQVRVILEAEAARLFAKNATEDNLRALAAVLDELRKLNESKNPEPYVLADVSSRFHSTIAAGSGNRYVEKYANDIRLKLRVVRVSLFTSLDRMNDELKEHTEIFQSLKERDSEGAWKKMYEHETKTMQYVIEKVIPRLV